jgi:hypothetical protein
MKRLLIIFIFLTLLVGIAEADIAPSLTCVRFEACLDGSNFVTVNGGQLSMVHHTYNPIGTLVDCREYPDYVNKVKVDGVFYDINAPGIDEPYTINGQPSLPVEIMTLDDVRFIDGRGLLHFSPAEHKVLFDDDGYSTGSMYSVDLCGDSTHTDSPEFLRGSAGGYDHRDPWNGAVHPKNQGNVSMISDSSFTDENSDMRLIERLRSRRPDARQLLAFLSQSYEYIKKLPLKGINENYIKNNPDLFKPIS